MNLWTEFDNSHSLPDATQQGRSPGARRLTERAILSLLRAWLLDDYAAAYCRSLGTTRIFRRCYWVDALGIDSKASTLPQPLPAPEPAPENRTKKGRKKSAAPVSVPPALQSIVSLSHTLAQESKPIALHGLVLAAGSSRRKEIKKESNRALPEESAIARESCIIPASWLEVAPLLLKEIEQSPAIFLLNPFSQGLFSYDDLAPLYQRTVPTELCLLISHKQAQARLLAALRSSATDTRAGQPTGISPGAALTGLLRSDRWKTLPAGEEEADQALDGIIKLFIAPMQRYFPFPVQRIALPVQVRPAAVEDAPYSLIFATRRQDSLVSMNDAVCLYRRRIYEQSHRGILGEEWFADQQRERLEAELQHLSRLVQQQGRARRIRSWPDLRQQLLLAHFGKFTLHDYDTLVQQLLVNGDVRCQWKRPSGEAAEARPPGNDDTLIWL